MSTAYRLAPLPHSRLVLVSPTLAGIRVAKQATKTTPIVMIITADPVAAGRVDSLARPGGNITGMIRITREISGTQLKLLKEVVPKISRSGILWDANAINFKDAEAAARALKKKLHSRAVRSPSPDFAVAFQIAAKQLVNALVTISGALISSYPKPIADLAIKHRMPSMHERINPVEAGVHMSYSTIDSESCRRAASYVDRILKGTKPADLPVEQPMKFGLVFNLKTAKQTGVTLPQ